MKIQKSYFGTLCDGSEVSLFTVGNGKMSFSVTDYGCTITSIVLGCGAQAVDVALGYSTLDGYIAGDVFFGAFIGRCANRIGSAKFTLGGKQYLLDKNDGPNSLHGGYDVWHKKVWAAKEVTEDGKAGVEFTRTSCDGEQGMPGQMAIKVIYLLGEDNSITMKYIAKGEKDCPINFTNHSYFNLAGKGTILEHSLQLDCDKMLPVDTALIPTGEMADVGGSVYDFREEKLVGRGIAKALDGVGYDNCYVTAAYEDAKKRGSALPTKEDALVHAATLKDGATGRSMTVETNMEGMQLYTGNFIAGKVGKNGTVYPKHGGLCLETQCFPDSPNQAAFPSSVLKAGEEVCAVTVYRFGW